MKNERIINMVFGVDDSDTLYESYKRKYIDLLMQEQIDESIELSNLEPDELLTYLHYSEKEFLSWANSWHMEQKSYDSGVD